MNCRKKCTQNKNFCKGSNCKMCCIEMSKKGNINENRHSEKEIKDIVKLTFSEDEEYCFNDEEIQNLKKLVKHLKISNLSFSDILQIKTSISSRGKVVRIAIGKYDVNKVSDSENRNQNLPMLGVAAKRKTRKNIEKRRGK